MPRRKQTRPLRMKYSANGKEEEEEEDQGSDPGSDGDGDDDDDAEDDSPTVPGTEDTADEAPEQRSTPDKEQSDNDNDESPLQKVQSQPLSPAKLGFAVESIFDPEPRLKESGGAIKLFDKLLPNMPRLLRDEASDIHTVLPPSVTPPSIHREGSSAVGVIQSTKRAHDQAPICRPHKPHKRICTEMSQDIESDQPLDLTKPLDLSKKPKKEHTPDTSHLSDSNSLDSTVSAQPAIKSQQQDKFSSLDNLEKRFGGNSLIFEGLSAKLKPTKNPMYQAFGGNLFTTALYNTPPMITTDHIYRPERTYWSSLGLTTSSVVTSKPRSPAPCTSSGPPTNVKPHTPENRYTPEPRARKESSNGKYTNYPCSCKKQFDTLYELTVHMDRTGHTPNLARNGDHNEYPKLVRGQDMWLNQGSEQTRQILRCMQCGESFKSLPELTIHMIKTKHYTNIVGSDAKKVHKCSSYCDKCEGEAPQNVFRCKVCQDGFPDMDSLANHMVISGHHKKQIVHSTSSESLPATSPPQKVKAGDSSPLYGFPKVQTSGSRSTVASILELQRQTDLISPKDDHCSVNVSNIKKEQMNSDDSNDEVTSAGQIRCENCGDKIDTARFVEHVRYCVKNKVKVLDALKAKLKQEDEGMIIDSVSREHLEYEPVHSRRSSTDTRPLSRDPSSPRSHDGSRPASRESRPRSREGHALPQDFRSRERRESRESRPCSREGSSRPRSGDSMFERSRSRESHDSGDRHHDRWSPRCERAPSCDSPSSVPILHSTTEPSSSQGMEGSALKAMESFIERSFVSTPSRGSFRSPKIAMNGGFNHLVVKPPKFDYPLPDSTGPILDACEGPKYLDPGFPLSVNTKETKDDTKVQSTEPKVKTEVPHSPAKAETKVETVEPKTEQKDTSSEPAVAEKASSTGKKSTKSLHQKYLQADVPVDKSKGSALQSLQGLVYGQTFSTEHPLDSLQKLIHSTENGMPHRPNGSQSILTGTATLEPTSMPSTVILVNPIVTVLPNSNAPPAVQINISQDSSPPMLSQHSPREDDRGTSSEGEGAEGDNRCQACNRSFASKGSYRYHRSRCHLSSVKKYGIKDAFNMSPYVYLPLDHSAKFNKYYEMANELANKSE